MTSPFVYTYRQFPVEDSHNLEKQLVNVSTQYGVAINQRTIGNFPLHVDGDADFIPNGERWFAVNNTKLRDGYRVIVQVSDAVLTVAHNITLINQVTRLYGCFQDGAGTWWPLPYIDLAAVNNQINIRVTATQIIVTKGAGAPPAINNGIVVLEFV